MNTGSGFAPIAIDKSAVPTPMPTAAVADVVQGPFVSVTLKVIVPEAGALN